MKCATIPKPTIFHHLNRISSAFPSGENAWNSADEQTWASPNANLIKWVGPGPTPYGTRISVKSDWQFLGSCYHPTNSTVNA